MTQSGLVRKLRDTITDVVIQSMGLSSSGWAGKLLAPLIWPAARRFAELFAAFDGDVTELGISEAARRLLPHFVQGCRQLGAESVPAMGPLLVASNHPGATDGIAIAASLPRDDLKIVISDVPFTRALPCARDHLIYAPRQPGDRTHTIREMIRHLQGGGAVLIFPSGHLDPDPAFLLGAAEGLAEWSRSVALVLRRVPQTRLLATIVGGVLVPGFLSHPLTRIGPKGWERQRLAEVLQIMQQLLFKVRYALTPRVTFGKPVTAAALRDWNTSGDLVPAIVDHARQVLALHLTSEDHASAIPLPTAAGS